MCHSVLVEVEEQLGGGGFPVLPLRGFRESNSGQQACGASASTHRSHPLGMFELYSYCLSCWLEFNFFLKSH